MVRKNISVDEYVANLYESKQKTKKISHGSVAYSDPFISYMAENSKDEYLIESVIFYNSFTKAIFDYSNTESENDLEYISILLQGLTNGNTFTISNGGVFGSMLSTPIINPPQSGILGMHNVVDRAIVKNGQIVIAPVMYVALSYDHRIIDGRESVGFLVAVKEALENPVEHLMNGNAKKALEL
jgi:hypothetical protein